MRGAGIRKQGRNKALTSLRDKTRNAWQKILELWYFSKNVSEYFFENFRHKEYYSRNIIFVLLLGIIIVPWLVTRSWYAAGVNVAGYVSFIYYLNDKIRKRLKLAQDRERIIETLLRDITGMQEFYAQYNIALPAYQRTRRNIQRHFKDEIDYNYFEDHVYKFVDRIAVELFATFDTEIAYCFRYLYFTEERSDCRDDFIKHNFNRRRVNTPTSSEHHLLKFLHEFRMKNKLHSQARQIHAANIAPEDLQKLFNTEFGDQISITAIEKITNDTKMYEKLKDFVELGIGAGLISYDSLKNLSRNKNEYFVIIKYGEGTSKSDWPKGVDAPFGKILNSEHFKNPYQWERYAFIRDLDKHPISEVPQRYVRRLLRKFENRYRKLKRAYPRSKVIQNGPHFELIGFKAEKSSFFWEKSKTRNLTPFMKNLIMDDVLKTRKSKGFLQSNYIKMQKIMEEIDPFSLIATASIREFFIENKSRLSKTAVVKKYDTIQAMAKLTEDDAEKLCTIFYIAMNKGAFKFPPKKKNKQQKLGYISGNLTRLQNACASYFELLTRLSGATVEPNAF